MANLIAAGEVVERPASAIKELIENAVDAEAKNITVEIQSGGISLMRVTDDGCGMSRADTEMCIRRHATSKIKDASDLGYIITLGFRGEALAAIASVSKLRIFSKRREDPVGTLLSANGGRDVKLTETGCADGTTVIAEELFANVPARRKFLKKDAAETMAVTSVVEKAALAHPEIAFSLICDGKLRYRTSGDGDLRAAIYAVMGRECATNLIPVHALSDGIEINGFVGTPELIRKNRHGESFFLNGRYVRNTTAQSALEAAFRTYIPGDRFPMSVLHLKIHPSLVDVNVHPAKLEVKFAEERKVFDALYSAVRGALIHSIPRPGYGPESAPTGRRHEGQELLSSFVPVADRTEKTVREERSIFSATDGRGDSSDGYIRPGAPKSGGGSRRAAPPDLGQLSIDYDGAIPGKPGRDVRDIPAAEGRAEADRGFTPAPDPFAERRAARAAAQPSRNGEYVHAPEKDAAEIPPTDRAGNAETWKTVTAGTAESNTATGSASANNEATGSAAASNAATAVTDNVASDRTASGVAEGHGAAASAENAAAREAGAEPVYYRIIGVAANAYVLVEAPDGVVVIDKHAAHERILFERMKENMYASSRCEQLLLIPEKLSLSPEEFSAATEYREDILKTGFAFTLNEEELSATVTSVPSEIEPQSLRDVFLQILSSLCEGKDGAERSQGDQYERALFQAACKAAVKAGREDDISHIEYICSAVMNDPRIRFCPHGRPVAFELTTHDIEKRFKRI